MNHLDGGGGVNVTVLNELASVVWSPYAGGGAAVQLAWAGMPNPGGAARVPKLGGAPGLSGVS